MSIILDRDEALLPLVDAVAKVTAKRMSIQSIRRWATKGVKGGKRLEFVRIGHEMRTSVEAVKRFLSSLDIQPSVSQQPNARTTKETKKRLESHFGKGAK